MRETKGPFTAFGADPPYVLKNSLCEVVLHIENLLLRERKCHGIDMASFGKKKTPTNLHLQHEISQSRWWSQLQEQPEPSAKGKCIHQNQLLRDNTCAFSVFNHFSEFLRTGFYF